MKRIVFVVAGLCAIVIAVGCSDDRTPSGTGEPFVAFYVAEVTCAFGGSPNVYTDNVTARVEFVPVGDSVGQKVRYESPGPYAVPLTAGEYVVRAKSGRGDGIWEMPDTLVVSGTAAPQVVGEHNWYRAPRMWFDEDRMLKISTVAYTSIPSLARIHFYYSPTADSLGTEREVEAVFALNQMTGRHMTIDVDSREVYYSERWDYLTVDYRVSVSPWVFLYDVLDEYRELRDADSSLFPSEMIVSAWGSGICPD